MSFWTLSPTGKNAQGRMGEIPNWGYQQMRDYYGKANNFYDQGGYGTRQGSNYWDQVLRTQQPSQDPTQNRQVGEQIMPGVNPYIQASGDRLKQQLGDFQNLPGGAQETSDALSGLLDQYGGSITHYGDLQRDAINAGWLRNVQRDEGANRGINANIASTYGSLGSQNKAGYGGLRGTSAGAYGGMRGEARDVYGNLTGMNDTAYGDIARNLEMLKPGGAYQQAQVARSYAPEMVSAAGRMRAAGASPMQAEEAMQGAERDRARGMDEAAARSTAGYVGALNDARTGQLMRALNLGQAGLNTSLGLSQADLANQLGFGQSELANQLGYTREQGGLTRDETLRSAMNQQGLDTTATAQQMANNRDIQSQTSNYFDKRMQNAQLMRAMQQQDWGTVSSLMDKMNANDRDALMLQLQQYQTGFGQNQYNQNLTGTAADRMGVYGQQAINNMFGADKMGQAFADQAMAEYLKSYGIEEANAGWGTKLLTNLAMGFLGAQGGGGLFDLFKGGGGIDIPMDRTIAKSPYYGQE